MKPVKFITPDGVELTQDEAGDKVIYNINTTDEAVILTVIDP